MATVPMDPSVDLNANPMGRFVAPEVAAPAVQQGPDYTGKQMEAMGAAMMNSGTAVIKIAERIQDDIDDAVTKKWDNETADFIRQEKNKYLLTQGQDAVKGYQSIEDSLKKFVADKTDSLDNEMQRKMYGKVADSRLLAARAEMSAHQLKAVKEWKFNETKNRVENLMNDAIADSDKWAVPGSLYEQRKAAMIAEVEDLAMQAGITKIVDGQVVVDRDSEQYKSVIRGANTKLHESVINQFVAQEQPKMAAAYLKNFKGDIDRTALDNLTAMVKKAEETVNVKEDSLRLQLSMAKVPFDQALTNVNQMFADGKISAELRDATVTRLEHQNQIVKQAENKVNAQMLGEAQEWMIRNPGQSVLNMPAKYQAWARETGHWASLKSLEKTGGQFQTNFKVWGKILTMPADELAKMSSDEFYAKYRGSLNDGDLERGMAMIGAAKAAVGKVDAKQPELTVFETNTEIVKRAAQENKILPFTGSPNENQQKDFAGFEKEVQRRVNEFELTQLGGKRKANTDEVKAITGQVLLDKVKIDEWGRDPEIPSYKLTQENTKNAYVNVGGKQIYLSQISDSYRLDAIRRLKAAGLPVTQQKIAEMWNADNSGKK
jgi:hypothetical protein